MRIHKNHNNIGTFSLLNIVKNNDRNLCTRVDSMEDISGAKYVKYWMMLLAEGVCEILNDTC